MMEVVLVAFSDDAGGKLVKPSRVHVVHSVMFTLSATEVVAWVYLD